VYVLFMILHMFYTGFQHMRVHFGAYIDPFHSSRPPRLISLLKFAIFLVNKQLNDKERVAAALENPNLRQLVDDCIYSNEL
jgi:hypothetical protein